MADPKQYLRKPIGLRGCLLTCILVASSALGGCATFPGTGGPILRQQIDEIISTPPLNQVNWGIRIVDPERRRILYSRNGHRKFVPASNMKLLATSTALSVLGPDYHYHTDLWGVGRLDPSASILDGDLMLAATGDPTFSETFYPTAEAPMDSLADALWRRGVRTVTGALVVDVSAWDSTTVPGSWMVQNLAGTSGATGGAFSIAEGELAIEVRGGPVAGAPAQARWWPGTDDAFLSVAYVSTDSDSATGGRTIDYLPESRRLLVSGTIGVGEMDTLRIAQRDPVRLASRALLRALTRRGIEIQGGLRIAWDAGDPVGPGSCQTGRAASHAEEDAVFLGDCPGAVLLASLTSPPMAEIVQAILEPSQNWMTEQLVRTLGMELGQRGSWREGFRVERQFLVDEVGVDSLDLAFEDGSGLSAYNLVTPRALVGILDYMRSSPNAGAFRNALASPGEEGSTLSGRLEDLKGHVFGKTGTITHVNSLTGYVFTDSGRELIFSILTNGSGLSSRVVRSAIDRVVEAVARH